MRFLRWDRALKLCMDKSGKNRWDSDPMILNQEAHELPVEKQRQALDFVEDASDDMRTKLAPMWKYCFVQWHIYDAGMEATEKGTPVAVMLRDPDLRADVETLRVLCDSGDLESASTSEEWMWKLLDPLPEQGTLPSDEVTKLIQDGKEERHLGVVAFNEERFDKALWHFWQGQKLLATAPGGGPVAKLRSELLKNRSAAALKLGLPRGALSTANAALGINQGDEKAWYRKYCALQALHREGEANQALARAGLTPPPAKTASKKTTTRTRTPALPDKKISRPKELDPSLLSLFEDLVFIEIGVDSVLAVDLVRHLQAELPDTQLSLSLIYDRPTVRETINELMGRINAKKGDYLRRRMASTVWRALCDALGKDPLKQQRLARSRPLYTEIQAIDILSDLQKAYESPSFVKAAAEIARQSAFEQRSFLMNLRPKALELQKPILRRLGLPVDSQGLRDLEAALINTARQAPAVREKLRMVRMAQQGGDNGMWTINVEQNPWWSDSNSMQLRAVFTKSDPFGAAHINTNAVPVN
ncbi:hypothetical protein AK812_SmicGene38938 [Symbiodinium microadriaticum]|uniref:Polyketide synthase-like phosphopantetheine-binding domain-containing protein n=1 Tax=Symbiodinium microadriaticum TaxID=2951 RepID=A0A1Q9CCI8_SYMMI|nr:hypothetical protein AK812_SmicGene38938 [Symbiodinium microadriaticum]CAE7939500.1 unnamed protein product [Symbiodinium sp. KB8]